MKTKILKFLIIFLNISFAASYAQDFKDIVLEDGEVPEMEIHAAINPNDTNHIVVASISASSSSDKIFFSIYYTFDFGESWKKSDFNGEISNYSVAGDPVVKIDNDGVVYLTNLSSVPSKKKDNIEINGFLLYSTDKGVTWKNMTGDNPVVKSADKPWIDIDNNPNSKYSGNKYYTAFASGPSSGAEVILEAYDKDNNKLTNATSVFSNTIAQYACVAVNSKGDVFVSGYQLLGNKPLIIAKSSDGGKSFQSASNITKSIKVNSIKDSIIGVGKRTSMWPYMAIDNSGGEHDGRIYVTFSDYEEGSTGGSNTILDVFLTWSDDDGKNWTKPKVVHQKAQSKTQQFFPNIYVNPNGDLLLAWYDGRDDLKHTNIDYYLGISVDGGNTIKEVKLTSSSSNFKSIGAKNKGFAIGDYSQVIATENFAIPFWADGRTNNGDVNIYYAKVLISGLNTVVKEVSSISDIVMVESSYPNPSKDYAKLNITAKEPVHLKWTMFDVNGKIVNESTMNLFTRGSHTITIALSNIKNGVYYTQIVSSEYNFMKTIKMVKKN